MRKYLLLFVLLWAGCLVSQAQAPRKLSYQAVLRDPSGQLITNQQIPMKSTLIQRGVPDSVKATYQETVMSNDYGLVAFDIVFDASSIHWENEIFFLQVAFYNEERPHSSIDMLTPSQAHQNVGELKKHWHSYRDDAIEKLQKGAI